MTDLTALETDDRAHSATSYAYFLFEARRVFPKAVTPLELTA